MEEILKSLDVNDEETNGCYVGRAEEKSTTTRTATIPTDT